MFLVRPPSDALVRERLARVASAETTCEHAGITREPIERPPAGYTLDHYGVDLGRGDAVFDRARDAIARFEHYPPSFSRVVMLGDVLATDLVFGTVATHLGFASIHPCRVLFVVDEAAPRRFGFGLGTLPGHIARGEESFEVAQREDGGVRLEVRAVSRPADALAWLGRPILRAYQARFRRELVEGMRTLCAAV